MRKIKIIRSKLNKFLVIWKFEHKKNPGTKRPGH